MSIIDPAVFIYPRPRNLACNLAMSRHEGYTSSMGIWDRLESVIKSYINDHEDPKVFTKHRSQGHDPDLDAAYEELDDFLNGKDARKSETGEDTTGGSSRNTAENDTAGRRRRVPEELREDFAELGLTPEATAEECKEAYKRLLKLHHPDRHAGHERNMEKATEKSARLNAAYDRLVKWFKVFG